jgi:hypothetical protein
MGRVTQAMIRKKRVLPAAGEVFVKKGEQVSPTTIVAKGKVRNPYIQGIRLDLKMGVDAASIKPYLLKKVGDEVKKDEVIALRRSFFGRTKICRAPIDGSVEAFLPSSGQILIRGAPIPIEVNAHIPGKIVEVIPEEGAVVEAKAKSVEGVFGVGGETHGEIMLTVERPDEALMEAAIEEEHRDKIVVGGSTVTLEALRRAREVGAKAVIVGGVDEKDLTTFLGYELGFGITGSEALGMTLILTEGFGPSPINEEIFDLLRSFQGKLACVDGTTQIRARMLRPEIIIPLS